MPLRCSARVARIILSATGYPYHSYGIKRQACQKSLWNSFCILVEEPMRNLRSFHQTPRTWRKQGRGKFLRLSLLRHPAAISTSLFLEVYWKRRNPWSNRLQKFQLENELQYLLHCQILQIFDGSLIWSLLTKTSFPLPSIQCIFPMLVLLLLCSLDLDFLFLLMVKWWWYWNWARNWVCGLVFFRFFSWLDLRLSNSEANRVMSLFFGPISGPRHLARWATLNLQFSYCGSLFGWGQGGMVTHLFIEHVYYTIWSITKLLCSHLLWLRNALQMYSFKKTHRVILLTLVSVLINQGVSK